MGTVTYLHQSKFAIGQLVNHRRFNYRGVIVDVDPHFRLSDEWYESMAISRPPKDKPWYHVLVHAGMHTTYVAERNLDADDSGEPVVHPMLEQFFTRFENGRYIRDRGSN